MSDQEQELVNRVIEVTGASEAESRHLLGACANDVEAAVALFFEQGGSAPAPIPVDDEDSVRAPIAPIREQIIGPDDHDNFFTGPPPARLLRVSRVKVCPLRDFEREGALMEEQLHAAAASGIADNFAAGAAASSNGSSRMRRRARAAAMVTAAQDISTTNSSSRLGDLFRPPTDIVYAGRFEAARMHATELKQWLLVNVQSDNFDSQVLNRDVWSDKEVRRLIGEQFLLWQVDSDSSEGRRFCAFYHCAKLPYVCVIDPRTGEEIWKSVEPKQSTLLQELQLFLRQHKDFSQELEEDAPSTSKRAACHNMVGEEAATSANPKKRSKIMELSEAEQIALAIRNSMSESGGVVKSTTTSNGIDDEVADDDEDNDDGDCDSIEEFVDDDTKGPSERTSYETQLGSAKDELTMIKLRLLNSGGADEVVQLRWPSDTPLQVLRLYITQQQPHIPKKGYKLICAYPRKTLEAEHDVCTLKTLGLHPSANLHVTLDD